MNDDKTRIAPDRSAVRIGTELNQTYCIDSPLGVGGMGEVFKGHNIQTGDPVAIKIVLPELAQDETILGLFRKEARILNHLSHDAIVRYYVFSFDPALSRPYLAMEFVDGPSLAAYVNAAPLPASEFMRLLRRLADGLHRVHQAGVIHRDMSPDNIILPGGMVQNAKIIDFGIARSANVGGETLLGGSFAGKYNFVSPEQLGLYGGKVTPKSDIYSLALVMASAMRGYPIDMSGLPADIIEKRRSVPDLSGIPAQFHAVLSAMLLPDPAERPADMAAIRDWPDVQLSPKPKPTEAKAISRNLVAAPSPISSNGLRNGIFVVATGAVIGIGVLGGWIYARNNMSSIDSTSISKRSDIASPESQTSGARDSQSEPRQDIVALQAWLDRCGADCPDDLAQRVRQQIASVKQRAAFRDRLIRELTAVGQDPAALQGFLDRCGADCPDDLAQRARQQIATASERAALVNRLTGELTAAGQDPAALQGFLDRCGKDCPDDLAERARQQIASAKQQIAFHDRWIGELQAAGQDPAALQGFLDRCGKDCPDDLAERARQQIASAKQQIALHDRLTGELQAAGQDLAALQGFLDRCGADCPDDITLRAHQQITTAKQQATLLQQAALHDRLTAELSAASHNLNLLQGFIDRCGTDCPDDVMQQAQKQVASAREQAALGERLATKLLAAGQDLNALQDFLEHCGPDCPDGLAQQARQQIASVRRQAALHDRLMAELSAAGQDLTALQGFLERCGRDCPDDIAQQAWQQIASAKRQAALHDRLAAELAAAGQDAAALQGFLDRCGKDCPDDIAQRAREQIASARQLAALHDRLTADLWAAGQDLAALRRFVDQCGADCPADILAIAKARIATAAALSPPASAPVTSTSAPDFAPRHAVHRAARPEPKDVKLTRPKRVLARSQISAPKASPSKASRPAAKCFTFSGSTFCE